MKRKILPVVLLALGMQSQINANESNIYNNGDYSSEQISDFEAFEQRNIWACYVVYDGTGRNIYYKGSPSNTRSQVAGYAMRQCQSVNADPSKCRLQECRFGPY